MKKSCIPCAVARAAVLPLVSRGFGRLSELEALLRNVGATEQRVFLTGGDTTLTAS